MKPVKVWDLSVRSCHALFGLLILGAFLTSDDDGDSLLHMRLGLVLLAVVLFRVVWGFVGSRHARFTDFVRAPGVVIEALRQMVRGRPAHVVGHNPVGAVMVLALLVTMFLTCATGVLIALGPEWSGPLALGKGAASSLRELHEISAWALPVLLALHVAGVIVSSLLEKQNLIAGMITGYKRGPEEGAVDRLPPLRAQPVRLATALLVGLAALLLIWRFLPTGAAEAATIPAGGLLGRYEQRARAEEPGFRGFDGARGRALYFGEHDSSSGKVSCATCHTQDPRQSGRSPVGRVIEPLAPSANSARFTDAAKADKWFDRNCKQVLGRACTASERGDFVTWLSSL